MAQMQPAATPSNPNIRQQKHFFNSNKVNINSSNIPTKHITANHSNVKEYQNKMVISEINKKVCEVKTSLNKIGNADSNLQNDKENTNKNRSILKKITCPTLENDHQNLQHRRLIPFSESNTHKKIAKFQESDSNHKKGTIEQCRICMDRGDIHIFGDDKYLADNIYTFAGVEISDDDPYPKYICIPCLDLLRGAILFRFTAQTTDNNFRQPINIEDNNSFSKHKSLKNINRYNLVPSAENMSNIIHKEKIFQKNLKLGKIKIQPLNMFKTQPGCFQNKIDQNIPTARETKAASIQGIDTSVPDSLGTIKKINIKTEAPQLNKSPKVENITNTGEQPKYDIFGDNRKLKKKIKIPRYIICDDCGKQLYPGKEFIDHVTKNHPERTKCKCKICGKEYKVYYFPRHMFEHANGPHVCEICGKCFLNYSSFRNHTFTHSTKFPYHCTLCPYKGKLKRSFTLHMYHHAVVKPYMCSECPTQFSNTGNLKVHMLRHKGITPFKCDTCKRSFYCKGSLKKHIKSLHIGLLEYACLYCDKQFGTLYKRRAHERRMHPSKYIKSPSTGRIPHYFMHENKIL